MIAGLLLASGASRRFGSNKLLARLAGRAVVRWSAEALASEVDATYVVVREDSPELRAALDGLGVHWVENPNAERGMGSSIGAGIAALPADAEAVVITLGDQPLIDAAVIRNVVSRWRSSWGDGTAAVTTSYVDGRGHPTLFGAALFPALRSIDGDRGARGLLESLGAQLAVIQTGGARPVDVDTPEALRMVERALESRT